MSNVGKYESSNPLKRALLNRFLTRTRAIVRREEHHEILDVGTGEGLFWEAVASRNVVGVDIRQDALAKASKRGVVPAVASATNLPFADRTFDFVMAIEVLEHLPDPEDAVTELARVCRGGGLITVPWEPWFSLMVLAGTGSHIRRLGREPEHIQAFGPHDLRRLMESHFKNVQIGTSVPWLIAEVSGAR